MPRPFPTDRLPDESIDVLIENVALWEEAVDFAADKGLHDVEYLTDVVFFAHHPKRNRRALASGESVLIREWKAYRERVAKIVEASKRAARVRALLIVPAQGHARGAFRGVAHKLKRELYRRQAEVVRASVPSSSKYGVNLEIDGGRPFSFGDYADVKTVMVISHAGPCDGPNLDPRGTGEQPWRVAEKTACTDDARLDDRLRQPLQRFLVPIPANREKHLIRFLQRLLRMVSPWSAINKVGKAASLLLKRRRKMDFSRLLSYIPGWIGFLALIIIGLLMFLNGVIEPFGPLDHANQVGFIVFGLAALLIGAASWIIGGTSQIRGRTGRVGVLVRIQDLPWWGYLVDGGVLLVAVILYLALTA